MPPTPQPDWKFIANLGDMNPLEHGGYFIYEDKTGEYVEEAQLIIPDSEDDKSITVYRIILERLKIVEGYLVPFDYQPNWGPGRVRKGRRGVMEWRPEDVANTEAAINAQLYSAWFTDFISSTADHAAREGLKKAFTSEDPIARAQAYRVVADSYGWNEFDSYPLTFTKREAKKRYAKELKAIQAGKV